MHMLTSLRRCTYGLSEKLQYHILLRFVLFCLRQKSNKTVEWIVYKSELSLLFDMHLQDEHERLRFVNTPIRSYLQTDKPTDAFKRTDSLNVSSLFLQILLPTFTLIVDHRYFMILYWNLSIYLSMSVYLPACPPICLPTCLCLSVCLYVCPMY